MGKYYVGLVFLTLAFIGLESCSTTKSNYDRKYNKVWKEIVASEEWKNSLVASANPKLESGTDFTTSLTDVEIASDNQAIDLIIGPAFRKKYQSLVARAYHKIILQAEDADIRLKLEYERWNLRKYDPELEDDAIFQQNLNQVNTKFKAHRRMLKGLRSWNVFSENRTGDLDYFKKENMYEVYRMDQQEAKDDAMIGFLMYRLADLYHVQESPD
tara:strand:+ start:2762 stop:3403 length:642 start_codon:yes stop_codon:yes gene_type:complete